jgi:hypothetical protein
MSGSRPQRARSQLLKGCRMAERWSAPKSVRANELNRVALGDNYARPPRDACHPIFHRQRHLSLGSLPRSLRGRRIPFQ